MKKWILVGAIFFSQYTMAAGTGGWSSIAYDPTTGTYGYAYGTYNQQQAESNAIAYCNKLNCRTVVSGYNNHIALAVSKTNIAFYGGGYAPDKYQAMYWAMYTCNQGPTSCRIIIETSAHD